MHTASYYLQYPMYKLKYDAALILWLHYYLPFTKFAVTSMHIFLEMYQNTQKAYPSKRTLTDTIQNFYMHRTMVILY